MTVLDTPPAAPATAPPAAPGSGPAPGTAPGPGPGQARARRTELAAFLKACRARVSPVDVGLPPGLRRRTPGLRREEVAQLAGVGVTWYTWLEQGRPINASEQVMSAVARALLLDAVERVHLFRLAGLPGAELETSVCPAVDPAMQVILDGLTPMPAAISNRRYDVLAYNAAYDALFPGATRSRASRGRRNSMWCAFMVPDCCNPFVNRDEELPRMVGVMRAAYASHVGEPAWEDWVRELSADSPRFRELWATQQVAPATTALKVFRHAGVGEIRVQAAYLTIPGAPELYMVVYTPEGERDRERMAWVTAHPDAPANDHSH
ncbi:helix-turn-helix transcriptional regulator [Kitasatospora sp. NBC_01287]|uniref:helix-turn-helix transcriptional regulator n=1 Tax=Kitasatospora sp. NBC_01287 TaxID=2903573 RepID=UPI0022508BE8|nr:helix-turn-helix transcriptional regulator [Kitasatospora sp. NBC_01287]MCX4749028.1 helix-turn-helix transcriptional regulator [Kitasatospora sp. NBC_01287]